MKHLHLYEHFKSKNDWEIGDVVVALDTIYARDHIWLHEDYKYEIVNIKHDKIKVKEVGFPYSDLIEYKTIFNGTSPVLQKYFSNKKFMTLEEWEFTQHTNKYNI